jgi:ATP-binding cassette subfamily B protein
VSAGTRVRTRAFVAGGPTMAQVAVSIGGVVLAYQAFRDVAEGLEKLLAAVVSWERVGPFWRAAAAGEPLGRLEIATATSRAHRSPRAPRDSSSEPLIDARALHFRYPDRPSAVLQQINLKVHPGERLLLKGRSGGGKSTLGKLLAGLRPTQAGLLLLDGLDRQTLGREGWTRRVLLVPQFHENHVFLGTFAFNLLMGRRWPPTPEDIVEAERTCHQVGLGPLLARMPGGLQQWVGETGWQFSHGERDRLFIARALLQGSDVLILDESLSALDPQAVQQTLGVVLERDSALLVIAHP